MAGGGQLTYRGLTVIDDPDSSGHPWEGPSGSGGNWLQDNFVNWARWSGTTHSAASDPGVTHDEADTAGIGKTFNVWSRWLNTSKFMVFICTDATAGAAKWDTLALHNPYQSNAIVASSGGNIRGSYAVDLQTKFSAATDVASGSNSFAFGLYNRSGTSFDLAAGRNNDITSSYYSTAIGRDHTISAGAHQCIMGGQGNTIGSSYNQNFIFGNDSSINVGTRSVVFGRDNATEMSYSFVMGRHAVPTNPGNICLGGSQFAAAGDKQTEIILMHVATTGATQTEMTPIVGTSLDIPSNTTWLFNVHVVGRRTDGTSQAAGYHIEGVIENEAGTVALVGSLTKTVLHEDNTTWDATVTANNTDDEMDVEVTGAASTNIQWVARVELTEASG